MDSSLQDDSLNASCHRGAVEVQNQANSIARNTQIGEHLHDVHGLDTRNALHLDDDQPLDNEIDAVLGDALPFVEQRNRDLSVDSQTTRAKFMTERTLIDRLEKAGSELPMDFYGTRDDSFGRVGVQPVM